MPCAIFMIGSCATRSMIAGRNVSARPPTRCCMMSPSDSLLEPLGSVSLMLVDLVTG